MDRISFDEMADSSPNPALFERTFPISLGECDAFVSHSWSDHAMSKMAALHRWRQAFIRENDREPIVW